MKTKLKICPRCDANALEKVSRFSICLSCNYNTVEDFSWRKFEFRPMPHTGTPLDPLQGMATAMNTDIPGLELSNEDFKEVQKLIFNLSWMQKNVLYLKLWKRFTNMSIAYFLNLTIGNVGTYLSDTAARFRYLNSIRLQEIADYLTLSDTNNMITLQQNPPRATAV